MRNCGLLLAAAFAAGMIVGAGQALAQASPDADRMSRIEAQMRTLTGQVEVLTHTITQLQAQLKKMQDDSEFRFKALETAAASPAQPAPKGQTPAKPATNPAAVSAPAAAGTSAPAATTVAPAATAGASGKSPAAGTDQIGTIASSDNPPLPSPGTAGPGAPPRPLGTVVVPSAAGSVATAPPAQAVLPPANQPLDLTALARGIPADTQPPQAATAPPQTLPVDPKVATATATTGDPIADYKKAYELFVAGQYAGSEAAFRQFLAAYPKDDRASDATYWLGQTLFSRGMYREAALEFVNAHKLYPKSVRAADTMLLLGKSLAGIPEREAACQTFAAALKQYPQMSASLKSRVISEQANAGC